MKRIYLNYAATTPLDPQVFKTMKPWLTEKFGNSASLESFGQDARRALEDSRETVAGLMHAKSNELIFTGSATESNNTAMKGIVFANRKKGKHIITTPIEHDCILNASKWLKGEGFDITYLPVDKYGLIDPADVEKAIRKDTILVSVMHGNNEIGTIEPIEEIGKICSEHDVYFHTDAAQTFGKIPVDVKKLNLSLMTVSSHKMYGPLGIAGLYVKEGVNIEPLLHGGGHEFGLRSSTTNVPGAVGFAEAVRIAKKQMDREAKEQTKLRDYLIENVLKIDESHLNGHPTKRLPNNANFWFAFIEGESLIMYLDAEGIAASTGSACSSVSLEPSHVLIAIGLRHEQAHGSLRLSLGRWTKKTDIDYTIKVLPKVVNNLRKISPFKK